MVVYNVLLVRRCGVVCVWLCVKVGACCCLLLP